VARGGGWKVAREEVREGKGVCAGGEMLGLCDERPVVELGGLCDAVRTIFGNRLLGNNGSDKLHCEGVKYEFRGGDDCHEELAAEEGAGGLGGVAVEDVGR